MWSLHTKLLAAILVACLVHFSHASSSNECGYISENSGVYTSFFDPTNGHAILNIKIITSNISGYTWEDIIRDNSKWDTFSPWVYCEVRIANESPVGCTAKRRGQWSMQSKLPSLTLKLKNAEYKKTNKISLNKSPWDLTRVKTKLTYELLQQVDNMASLFTQFVNLTVNGQPYGLYTWFENLNEEMLAVHELGVNSNLYKASSVFWSLTKDQYVKPADSPEYNETLFENNWGIRGKVDHSVLIQAYKDVSDANVAAKDAMERNFNVNNFATWLAFNVLIANYDIYFNNFAIYAPEKSPTCPTPPIYMMQWDNDGGWVTYNLDGYRYGIDYPRTTDGLQYFWSIRTVKRFLQVDEFVDIFESKFKSIALTALSPNNIQALINQYKSVIQPILAAQPDVANLAWGATIGDWKYQIDRMALLPATQYAVFYNTTADNPMPFHMFMSTTDGSSYFFYWEKSFILHDAPLIYEFSIGTSEFFETRSVVATLKTNKLFTTMAATSLNPNTVYYWKVICWNQNSPDHYMHSYQSLRPNGGFGISTFTTPQTLPPPYPTTIASITNIVTHVGEDGTSFQYATLDNVESTAPSVSYTCKQSLALPPGWFLAENSAQTRENIAELTSPWGGGYLVLSDGVRVNSSTGFIIDEFGEAAQHFIASVTQRGIVSYSTDCTPISMRILITTNPTSPNLPLAPPLPDHQGVPSNTSGPELSWSAIAFALLYILLTAYFFIL